MKNKYLYLLLISLVFCFASRTKAVTSISQIKIDASINKNGAVKVEESFYIPYFSDKTDLILGLGNQKPKNPSIKSNQKILSKNNYNIYEKNRFYYLSIKPEFYSNDISINYSFDGAIHLEESLETLRWAPIIAPSSTNSVLITVTIPQSLNPAALEANIYPSQNSVLTNATIISGNKVRLQATNLSKETDATILIRWPEGVVNISYWKKILGHQSKTKLFFSILSGFILPFIALIGMLIKIYKNKKNEKIIIPEDSIGYPPDALSPIELGILFDKKIYSREIIGIIISLATRGYLVIANHESRITIAQKHTPDLKMSLWEKKFYWELFHNKDKEITEADIKTRVAQSLSSKSIVELFENAYQETTAKGFFKENPHYDRIQYKVIGLLFYFLSIEMMFWVLLTGQSSLYLFPICGVLLAAYVIIKLSHKIPTYTQKGNRERIKWLRFKNWLVSSETIGYESSVEGLFYKYLPYAVIFNCVELWANRFRQTAITAPEWYITALPEDSANFNQKIIPFIDSISKELSSLHGPNVS